MSHTNNLVRCFMICLALMLVVIVVACVPTAPIEVTRVAQVMTETATSEPISEEIEATATLIITPTATSTIAPSPTLLPSPSPANTATPSPTVSPLQKVAELPINGSQYGTHLAITSDGTLLAISSSSEDAIYIFDMFNQTVIWRIVEDYPNGVGGFSPLVFSPDGRYLAAWDNEFVMFVVDINSGEIIYKMKFDRDREVNIESASFSPDSQLLALSSFNHPAMIYSMATGELIDTFPSLNIVTYPPTDGGNHFLKPYNHYGMIMDVVFIPNFTNLLAIAVFPSSIAEGEGVVGGLYFWDMGSKSLQNVLPGGAGTSMVVSPNGQLLVTRVDDQLIGWNVQNNSETFTIKNIEGGMNLVSITDVGFFAALNQGEGLKIWNFSGELVATLNPDKSISDAVFMPDGRLLIAYSGDDNPPIEMWEINQ